MGFTLAAAAIGSQMYSTYKQGQLQAEQYEQMAEAERQKAAIASKKAEIESENDAYAQKQRNAQMAVVRGSIAAKAGASGAFGGSFNDLLTAAQNAYEEDTMRALYNQRQKQTNYSLERNSYINQANAYSVTADNVMSAAKSRMWATLASGVASMYAKGMFGSNTGGSNVGIDLGNGTIVGNPTYMADYSSYSKYKKSPYTISFGG